MYDSSNVLDCLLHFFYILYLYTDMCIFYTHILYVLLNYHNTQNFEDVQNDQEFQNFQDSRLIHTLKIQFQTSNHIWNDSKFLLRNIHDIQDDQDFTVIGYSTRSFTTLTL